MDTLITDQNIRKGKGYGQYIITGKVNGIPIKVSTQDSEAFDWFDDDENVEKHEASINHVNMKLEMVYKRYYK